MDCSSSWGDIIRIYSLKIGRWVWLTNSDHVWCSVFREPQFGPLLANLRFQGSFSCWFTTALDGFELFLAWRCDPRVLFILYSIHTLIIYNAIASLTSPSAKWRQPSNSTTSILLPHRLSNHLPTQLRSRICTHGQRLRNFIPIPPTNHEISRGILFEMNNWPFGFLSAGVDAKFYILLG